MSRQKLEGGRIGGKGMGVSIHRQASGESRLVNHLVRQSAFFFGNAILLLRLSLDELQMLVLTMRTTSA